MDAISGWFRSIFWRNVEPDLGNEIKKIGENNFVIGIPKFYDDPYEMTKPCLAGFMSMDIKINPQPSRMDYGSSPVLPTLIEA